VGIFIIKRREGIEREGERERERSKKEKKKIKSKYITFTSVGC
jgi:hypothetical protein